MPLRCSKLRLGQSSYIQASPSERPGSSEAKFVVLVSHPHRDAITFVHAIGECYLWVDSTCTIRDDLKMQQTEIMQMGSIYSNALFTIIVAAGDHANSGLPGVKRRSREQVQKILKLADSELLTVIDFSNSLNGIDDLPGARLV